MQTAKNGVIKLVKPFSHEKFRISKFPFWVSSTQHAAFWNVFNLANLSIKNQVRPELNQPKQQILHNLGLKGLTFWMGFAKSSFIRTKCANNDFRFVQLREYLTCSNKLCFEAISNYELSDFTIKTQKSIEIANSVPMQRSKTRLTIPPLWQIKHQIWCHCPRRSR